MSVKVIKSRFMQFGKTAPEGSRFQGILNSEALIGYSRYTNRKEAKEDQKAIGIHKGGYFGYTTREDSKISSGDHIGQKTPTMSSEGFIDTPQKRKEFEKLLSKSFCKDGDAFYENIISLSSFEEAQKYGMLSENNWNALLNEELPKIFKRKGFDPSNMIWWADLHINTEHPHVHLIFLEKETTVDYKKFKPKDFKYFKRRIFTNLSARKDLVDKQEKTLKEIFKDKDMKFKEITRVVDNNLKKKKYESLNDLLKVLPRTGRLQYNSKNMKDYQPLIKKYIDEKILSNKKTKKAFDEWIQMLDMLEENMNESSGQKIANIKEAELEKFYTQIGNRILQEGKQKLKPTKKVFNKKLQKEILVADRFRKYNDQKLMRDINHAVGVAKKEAYEMMMLYEISQRTPKFEQ